MGFNSAFKGLRDCLRELCAGGRIVLKIILKKYTEHSNVSVIFTPLSAMKAWQKYSSALSLTLVLGGVGG